MIVDKLLTIIEASVECCFTTDRCHTSW